MAPEVDSHRASLLIPSIHSGGIRSSGRGDSPSPCLHAAAPRSMFHVGRRFDWRLKSSAEWAAGTERAKVSRERLITRFDDGDIGERLNQGWPACR